MGWWRRYLDWRLRSVQRLTLEDGGFSIHQRGTTQRSRWSAVRSVTAYKRDLYTLDLLCLLFDSDVGLVEVHEEMEGYRAFAARMEEALGMDDAWKLGVLFPAFAANPTTIYARELVSAGEQA